MKQQLHVVFLKNEVHHFSVCASSIFQKPDEFFILLSAKFLVDFLNHDFPLNSPLCSFKFHDCGNIKHLLQSSAMLTGNIVQQIQMSHFIK